MEQRAPLGQIVILNGTPRSGKSSIAAAMQQRFDRPWMNLGVDAYVDVVTPPAYRPGIGLRPGGERPDLERHIPLFYAALYESIAAHSRLGLDVVADIGHHDSYAAPLHVLPRCARRLAGFPVLFVGVRCPIGEIMRRRDAGQAGRDGRYLTSSGDGEVPAPVQRWQQAVHQPGIYDLELDTSVLTPAQCAEAIAERLRVPPSGETAFQRLAASSP